MSSHSEASSRETTSAKYNRLNRLDASILELQSQLQSLLEERDGLRNELANRPARQLPPEILCQVFESIEGEHPESPPEGELCCECELIDYTLESVSLVCKQWYQLVISTPRVWTIIHLAPPDYESGDDHLGWARAQKRWIERRIDRSKILPLDVIIDYQRVSSPEEYVHSAIYDTFSSLLPDPNDENQRLAKLGDIMDHWSGASKRRCMELYSNLLLGPLKNLVGVDGENMKRWETLRLILPFDEEMAIQILDIINHDAPRVRHLAVFAESIDFTGSPGISRASYNSLVSVHILGSFDLSLAPHCPNITSLRLDKIEGRIRIRFLSELNHLQHLYVTFTNPGVLLPDEVMPSIELPDLKTLYIDHFAAFSLLPSLSVPRLERLTFKDNEWESGNSYPASDALTTVKIFIFLGRLEVRLERGDNYRFTRDEYSSGEETEEAESNTEGRLRYREETERRLESLLAQLSNVESIGVIPYAKNAMRYAVMACREKGQLPLLRSIVSVHRDGTDLSSSSASTMITAEATV